MRDPYEVLGVGRNATEAEIKAAFRRQAAQHHPDRNPGDAGAQQRFADINAAHQILSDAEKRAAWDRYGEAAFRPGGAGRGAASGPGGVGGVDLGGLDGVLGDLLGAMGIRTGGRDEIRQKLVVSFEEAARGCTREIAYQRHDTCERCTGSGAQPGTTAATCTGCGGRGRVRLPQAMLPIAMERPCPRCRGTGRVPEVPCTSCQGVGVALRPASVEVTLPPGVEHGATRTVDRAGHRLHPERPPGALVILVEVTPHPLFTRAGDDLVCRVPISFVQAALGGEIEVPTLEGKAKLRVPPATQPGSVLRMKGKGIAHRLRSGKGDQLVEVTVEVPTALTPRARELLSELGDELGEDVLPQQKTFLDKLKGLFD